jgi:transposase InsO family protein
LQPTATPRIALGGGHGLLFLAVVLDAWSHRIVGWAFSHDLKTQLILDALDMAIAARKPREVIHHSDKGSQYASWAFGHRCRAAGVRPSTGSAGDALYNAMCESFFATLQCELIDRHRFASKAEAQDRRLPLHRRCLQPDATSLVHRLSVAPSSSKPPVNPTVPHQARPKPKPVRESGSTPTPTPPYPVAKPCQEATGTAP